MRNTTNGDALPAAPRSNSSTSSNSSAPDAIPDGALVRLDCGTLARCYPTMDGRYRTLSRTRHGGVREDLGWTRDRLVVVPEVMS